MTPPAPPEPALLLATARPHATEPALAQAIALQPDWTAAIDIALYHGTAGLLCRRVLDIVPDDLHSAMTAYLDSCGERQRIATAELLELLDIFAQAGIPALPFKGPAFASLAYPEPTLRPCIDLDLLIHERDITAVFAILENRGFVSQYPDLLPDHRAAYHRYNGHDCLIAPGRAMIVEPHWQIAPPSFGVPLDTAALFRRARPVALGGRSVPTLCPEDALLVAALHASKEEWARLIWIADIATLLATTPAPDAEAALARATESGMRRMLLIGLALATDLLHAPCPAPFAAALAHDPKSRQLASLAAEHLWRQRQASSVYTLSPFRWFMRERLRDRLRYATATLLTARVQHFQAVNLPRPLRGLYPLVRLGHDFIALPLWQAIHGRDNRPPA